MKTKIRDFIIYLLLFFLYTSYVLVFFGNSFYNYFTYGLLFFIFLVYYNRIYIKYTLQKSFAFVKIFFSKKIEVVEEKISIDIFTEHQNEPKKEQKKKQNVLAILINNPKTQEILKNPKVIKTLINCGIGFLVYVFTAFVYCTFHLIKSVYNLIF